MTNNLMQFLKNCSRLIVSFTVFLFLFTTLAAQNEKVLLYKDHIYEKNIHSVLLFPGQNINANPLLPAVLPIVQNFPLILKFDEVYTDEADRYMVKILHCNMDWTPSGLKDMEFLNEYNEFSIDQFDFSMATKVHYTHFTFAVPRVKIPGNYIIMVYRNNDEKDLIITRRFFVYDNRIQVISKIGMSTGVSERLVNQQINFTVDYSNMFLSNPLLDIKVVIRQNHRWDNAIIDIRPSMVREDINQLVYNNFDLKNNFRAGNEFRFFDMRSLRYSGQNIEKIIRNEHGFDAFLYIDKSRETLPYTIIQDLNGGYYILNKESSDSDLEADYAQVHFFLELPEKLNMPVYLAGKLTDWFYSEDNKMRYLENSGLYTCSLLLKEGMYDYCYMVPDNSDNVNILEGNHFETRNEYEIIVYYRDPSINSDMILGYMRMH